MIHSPEAEIRDAELFDVTKTTLLDTSEVRQAPAKSDTREVK